MSEHNTGASTFDKALYWERRRRGVPGQIGYVNVHQPVLTEDGPQSIPIRFRKRHHAK